jgi:hypothetical protein
VSERRREHRPERRVHLSEAATILGVSKDAVRMRVKRGTLRSEKGGNGRVYVWVNDVANADPNGVPDPPETEPYRELVEELRDRVRYLERQVEEERDSRRRADTLLAQLMQRIPELEAPRGRTRPDDSPGSFCRRRTGRRPRAARCGSSSPGPRR